MNYRNIIINFLILLASLSKAQEQKHSDQLNESIIKNYLANHELKAFKDSIDLEKFLTLLTKSIYQVNNFLQMAILRNLVPKELNIWHQFEEVELNLETTTLIKKNFLKYIVNLDLNS